MNVSYCDFQLLKTNFYVDFYVPPFRNETFTD